MRKGKRVTMSHPFFTQFNLTSDALKERADTIGGSEINILAESNPVFINELYHKKINGTHDDLSMVWPVIMGHVTEELNLEWCQHKQGIAITDRQRVLKGVSHKFMRCTLDGAVRNYKGSNAVIDAKFTMGRPLKGEAWDEVVPRLVKKYTPQLHWNGYLLAETLREAVDYGLLTILKAGNEPTFHEIELDQSYTDHLIGLGAYFSACVEMQIPPSPTEIKAPPVPLEERVTVDMTGNEDWKRWASSYIQTLGAVESFKEAEKQIKEMVPANAREAHGEGLIVKVAKNNSKRIEVKNGEN